MQNLVITLCLALSTLSVSAQLTQTAPTSERSAPGVTLSEMVTFKDNEVVPYAILPCGNDFFLHSYFERTGSKGLPGQGSKLDNLFSLKLFRFDEELRQSGAIDITWTEEQRDHLSLSSLGNQLLWTFATETDDSDTYQIKAEVLDDEGKLVSHHELLDIDPREFHSLKALEKYSPDRKYYVRVYAEESADLFLSNRDTEAAALTIAVFDNNGKIVSLKKTELACIRSQLQVQSITVDNDGSAYVLAKIYANAQRSETTGGSDAQIFLYTLDSGAEKLERVEMRLDGQYIEGISMVPSNEGSVAIVGVYRDLRGGRITGYFSTDNPRKGEVINVKPFSQELLKSLGKRTTIKKRRKLVLEDNFGFREAMRLSNGQLTILLESFDVHGQTPTVRIDQRSPLGTEYDYIFGEGVMLTFDPEGELSEATVVPKFQSTKNFGNPFFRLNLIEYQGRPAAIYNDNPANFMRDLSKSPRVFSLKRALAIICYTDARGNLQREPIFAKLKPEKLILMPSSATRLANNDVVFMALRYRTFGKNRFSFGRISG